MGPGSTHGVKTQRKIEEDQRFSEPVQVNVRLEKSTLKVLRAAAAYLEMPFSALMESMAVMALHGQCLFNREALKHIEQFREIYGMNALLDSLEAAAHEAQAVAAASASYDDEEEDDEAARADALAQLQELQRQVAQAQKKSQSSGKKR